MPDHCLSGLTVVVESFVKKKKMQSLLCLQDNSYQGDTLYSTGHCDCTLCHFDTVHFHSCRV